MRFDKWTLVLGAAAVVLAVVLGALAGALAGVLTALSGAVFVVLWQIASNRQARIQAGSDRLRAAAAQMALPQGLSDSPAGYLRAEEQVVSFRPRPELDVLRDWLAAENPAGVRLVTGDAGSGKTRLAIELASHAAEFGYRCYWVGADGEQQAAEAAVLGPAPVLLLVDYAETRSALVAMLAGVLGGEDGPAVRVLLVARSAGEWWQQLITESEARISDLLAATAPIPLGPLSAPSGQEDVFRQALAAFAAKLNCDWPDIAMPPLGTGAVVLVVHAAALLAVLDRQAPAAGGNAGQVTGPQDVIGRLLGHEARYWEHTQARYQLTLSPAVRERAVAIGTLAGAGDENSATRLLAAIGDLADAGLRGQVARWLHDLYPAGPGSAGGEWIGSLRPDLIAEHLIVKVLTSQPQLASVVLGELTGRRAVRALTTLGRAALTQPAATALIEQALAARPGGLIVPAMTVAVETNPGLGDLILTTLKSGQAQPDLLTAITAALPDASVVLAGIAVSAYERLAEIHASNEDYAGKLVDLSNWLSRVGRREDALAAIDRAVAIRRELAAARPDAFLPDLAAALNNQSVHLAALGRREEALAAIEQAVTAYRDLAAGRPDAFLPALAMSLNNQSVRLADLGRREEALAAIEQAVAIRRDLAAGRPDAFLPALAMSLNNQSVHLADLGRREEALAAIEQAVAIRRDLAAGRPDAFLPDLAMSLNNQSVHLADLGRREEALAAIEQAVTAYRDLAAARPDAFLPALAMSLNNQSVHLADLGRREEALAAIDQAVAIRRDLAAARPDAFLPALAMSLNNQSVHLADLGRREEALAAIDQAVAIRRDLAAARPDAFLPDLATSLNNQSLRLADLGPREEALAAIDQAVAIRRDLAAARPDAFLPDLAMSLNNQSLRLADLGRREEALTAIDQAVAIRRDLAAARPDAFLPDLATSLNNQSNRLADLGRREEALAAIDQAVAIRRDLARVLPDVFGPRLRSSLTVLADLLDSLGKAATEAVTRTEVAELP